MRTSVKVMLAAIGAAVVGYPVMAGTVRNGYVQPDLSTDNVFWGMPYPGYPRHPAYEHPAHRHPPYGYGSAAHPPGRLAPGGTVEGVNPPIVDCVHVLFPQCGSGG
jgi:hypothetical protein